MNLDLIYGTPGESDQDWAHSVQAALAARPDHISAYALIVEEAPGWPRESLAVSYPRQMRTPPRTVTSRRTTCLPPTG